MPVRRGSPVSAPVGVSVGVKKRAELRSSAIHPSDSSDRRRPRRPEISLRGPRLRRHPERSADFALADPVAHARRSAAD
jgi:hypothetical protein